jgi:hypothetical protein
LFGKLCYLGPTIGQNTYSVEPVCISEVPDLERSNSNHNKVEEHGEAAII